MWQQTRNDDTVRRLSLVAVHLHIQLKSSGMPFKTSGGVFELARYHPSPNSVDATLTDRKIFPCMNI